MENKAEQTETAPIFGFDIGIASVGWAVLASDRIVALGVRAFDKAETAKEGESLNKVRRDARLVRRRLRRRAWRQKKLARLLKQRGLVGSVGEIRSPLAPPVSPWQLRVEGLDRRLTPGEWAAVVYHLCKHRGFHWISRAEEKKAEGDNKSEGGRVKQGLAGTARLMQEKGYRTAAEMVLAEFPEAQRNKRGEYRKALERRLLGDELKLLFQRQRDLGNGYADPALEAAVLGSGDGKSGLFWQQKPALSGADLLKMLGRCTFEKDQYRAPRASFTAERHVWLTRLNNLRLVVDGQVRPLTPAERAIALPLPYAQAGDFKYRQLRAALVKAGLTDRARFAGLPYPSEAQIAEGKAKDPEDTTLVKLTAWQSSRLTLKKAGLETEWQGLAAAALDGRPEVLDSIGYVLSVFKDDDEVGTELRKLALPAGERMIDALLDLRFDGFHALSLKALRSIVPLMSEGLRFDEACDRVGYRHSQPNAETVAKQKYLTPLYSGRSKDGRMLLDERVDAPRNPVVLRALNQARKVLNALVRAYGSPAEVRIEMARDLSRPLDERRKVEKEQTEYRERNERDRAVFVENFGREPKGAEFEKWRLYREQQGKCAYSLAPLAPDGDVSAIFNVGATEIDHALPYSRSFDDSKNNKVLVLARENRDKGNLTPYEFLGGAEDSPRWRQFVAFVETNKAYRLAKRNRLLRRNFGVEEAMEFRERNLNDTRYICRFFKNYVEQHLQLAPSSDANSCVVVNGQLTAFLRARWGLLKVRSESDRHHALDAAVVAACTRGMVKALADYSRRRELEGVRAGFVDLDTGEIVDPAAFALLERRFPAPWPNFRYELDTRLREDDPAKLRIALETLGTYPPAALDTVHPLFVSRAPQRRSGGAAHKETVYGRLDRENKAGAVTQKVPLASLTLRDIDNLIDPHRNVRLYAAIRARLEAHNGKGEKAFPADNPLRKPDRDGNPTGPIVRTATLVIDKLSGIPVRGGVAKNDVMLRVDVFAKGGKFYLVPVYVHHRVKGLPNRAIVAHKEESQWTEIDAAFEFRFSLHPNDLVRISLRNESFLGYFAGCDRAGGTVHLWAHDRNRSVGTDGLIRGIGAKTALAIEKLHVDCLGNVYPAPPEVRRGLA